ncbi:UNVERIFIED_CONTAM: hypothetical protein K2H54_026130 [Gekko kuhli]
MKVRKGTKVALRRGHFRWSSFGHKRKDQACLHIRKHARQLPKALAFHPPAPNKTCTVTWLEQTNIGEDLRMSDSEPSCLKPVIHPVQRIRLRNPILLSCLTRVHGRKRPVLLFSSILKANFFLMSKKQWLQQDRRAVILLMLRQTKSSRSHHFYGCDVFETQPCS